MAKDPSKYKTKGGYRRVRLRELLDEGRSEEEAEEQVTQEWSQRAQNTTRREPEKRQASPSSTLRRSNVSNKKNDVSFKYGEKATGVLDSDQARDAAIGLLEGLLEYADASDEQEFMIMLKESEELFGDNPPTLADSSERRLGYDLAPFFIKLLVNRRVTWSELEPRVLAWHTRGQQDDEMSSFGRTWQPPPGTPGQANGMTPEQELGIAPAQEKQGSLGFTETAIKATVGALEEIIKQ